MEQVVFANTKYFGSELYLFTKKSWARENRKILSMPSLVPKHNLIGLKLKIYFINLIYTRYFIQ